MNRQTRLFLVVFWTIFLFVTIVFWLSGTLNFTEAFLSINKEYSMTRDDFGFSEKDAVSNLLKVTNDGTNTNCQTTIVKCHKYEEDKLRTYCNVGLECRTIISWTKELFILIWFIIFPLIMTSLIFYTGKKISNPIALLGINLLFVLIIMIIIWASWRGIFGINIDIL